MGQHVFLLAPYSAFRSVPAVLERLDEMCLPEKTASFPGGHLGPCYPLPEEAEGRWIMGRFVGGSRGDVVHTCSV